MKLNSFDALIYIDWCSHRKPCMCPPTWVSQIQGEASAMFN